MTPEKQRTDRILMVDDRPENLLALKTVLAPLKAELHQALSGNQALEMMLEHEYALVLMDVQMPEMDGFETVEIMRQDRKLENTPVIFVSAIYKDDIHSITGIERGAVDFIIKPIIPEVLIGKVRIFLNLYREKDELKNLNREYERSEKALKWELKVSESLAELANSLIEPSVTIQSMADKVHEIAMKLTESEFGFVSEIDTETGDNVGHTLSSMMGDSCHVEGEAERIVFKANSDGTYPKLWGKALNTGRTVIVNDYKNYPEASGVPSGHVIIENFMAVPVLYDQKVLGEIALSNNPGGYSDREREAVEKVAAFYALALQRQREEAEKIRLEKELQQADKMRAIGQLAGGVAHDFNNQLAMILGNAELCLDERYLSPEGKVQLEQIVEVSTRAGTLTRQLLAYARKDNIRNTEIHPDKILREVINVLTRTINKKIEIRESLKSGDALILGDPSQIYTSILNIALNGRDAMIDGGVLSLSSRIDGEWVVLVIEDTGIGIPEELQEKIFEPFFTTKPVGSGTGLGLSAVQGIVKMHSGVMEVKSRPGEGTRFTLRFPFSHSS